MADIDQFVGRVATQFSGSQQLYKESQGNSLARYNLALSRTVVGCLVRAVYYASMIQDEGRYPAVCLMSYRKDSERAYHFPFCPLIEPTAQEIAKLAHAVGPGSHLCIECDDGKPMLAGIQVTILDAMRQFGYSSFRVGNPLKLLIRGAGYIEVSTGGIALVYKAGEISEERPLQYAGVMHALAAAVTEEFAGLPNAVVESLDDIFNDLAKEIVRMGHGGMLLFTKRPDLSQFSSHRRSDCHLLRQLLIRYYIDVATLNAAGGSVANLLAAADLEQTSPHSLTVSADTTMLENCISSIARLAGMDGAIVMDHGCNVVAFNAIISRDAEGAAPARLVDVIGRSLKPAEVGRNRGSRHQSAMSFARRVPNSFAFVISQDGGVTAFHNRGDGTCRWEGGLRVLD